MAFIVQMLKGKNSVAKNNLDTCRHSADHWRCRLCLSQIRSITARCGYRNDTNNRARPLYRCHCTENQPFERNAIHTWIVEIKDKQGNPVEQAKLIVGGGMPRHGHGLPTQPEMTAELGQGKYRVDGVRFHMFGWWEFSFDIDAAPGKDRIVFNLNL